MQRWVAVAVWLVLASSVFVGASCATAPDRAPFAQPERFDETTFEITVFDNHSARWAFEHRRPLENDSQVAQFRDFAREFESNRTELYRNFVDRSHTLVALGSDATGRNMTAIHHARSASVNQLGQRQGVARLSFTWTEFARQTDGNVVIGDVFEGGIPIGTDQRLVVRHGPSLSFVDALPEGFSASGENLTASDSITWLGEKRFADNRPHVEFLSQATPPADSEPDSSVVMFVGLLLIVAVLAAGVAYQRGVLDSLPGSADDNGGGAVSETTTDADAASSPPEPEVVSDRDRVKTLLTENGGRMKQVRIVDETDWSKSKVSMLLSEMEEEGEISKLRVGRENIVSLSGHEPDAAGSPFDEE